MFRGVEKINTPIRVLAIAIKRQDIGEPEQLRILK